MTASRLASTAAILLTALLATSGCANRSEPREIQGAVLIVLDTVRADHLSCYGYGRETSPVMDRLAEEGVLFEKAVCFSPWTLPSMLNLLSASRPDKTVFERRLKRSVVESLAAAGYRTAAFTEGGYVSRSFGMDLGFTEYSEKPGVAQPGISAEERNRLVTGGIEKTFSMAKEWLAANAKEKFFILIHTYEAHVPYTRDTFAAGLEPGRVGPEFTVDAADRIQKGTLRLDDAEIEYITALYDGGILECDRQIGSFLEHLGEIGLRDSTLIAVTSDHGEELGDHYPSFSGNHGHSFHEEMVLVPLIVHNPCEKYPAGRIPHQVRLMDVLPTIAEITGAPVDTAVDGESLLSLLRGDETRGRVAYGGNNGTGPARIFLRYLDFKYIECVGPPPKGSADLEPVPPQIQLYNLRDDPGEMTNLSMSRPEIIGHMRETFRTVSNPGGGEFVSPEIENEELRERLRALGYLR